MTAAGQDLQLAGPARLTGRMLSGQTAPVAASELAAVGQEFPGWHLWTSRPRGLLWATRLGSIHYDDKPRPPGWSLTAGPAENPAALRALLTEQRALDADPAA